MYIYFDSGTTYSRIYLTDGREILDFDKHAIGSKDTSVAEENLLLVEELKTMYDTLLHKHSLTDTEIEDIYASGMVTSPFGIQEVAHVPLPVTFEDLCSHISCYYEPYYFKRDIHLIPGVKNIVPDSMVVKQNFWDVNSTRGEEFETFGILEELPKGIRSEATVIILPGSHTQALYVKNGVICDVLSTISGELFYAISADTILSSSILKGSYQAEQEMVLTGFTLLQKYGFNRALYLVNTMKVFSTISKVEKTSYLEGVITGGVVQALQWQLQNRWRDISRLIVAGSEHITFVYEILLKNLQPQKSVGKIILEEGRSFSAKAFLKLLKRRG